MRKFFVKVGNMDELQERRKSNREQIVDLHKQIADLKRKKKVQENITAESLMDLGVSFEKDMLGLKSFVDLLESINLDEEFEDVVNPKDREESCNNTDECTNDTDSGEYKYEVTLRQGDVEESFYSDEKEDIILALAEFIRAVK